MAGSTVVRMILIQVIVIVVLISLLFGGYFYYTNSINYITTDDAQVTGMIVPITVPLSGQLSSWNVTINSTVNQGDALGALDHQSLLAANQGIAQLIASNSAASQKVSTWENITSPITGTVIQSNVNPGQMLQPGQVLAEVVDLNKLDVTANIQESDIGNVKIGQVVDVTLDGIPNTTFKGSVQSIGEMTESAMSLVPNVTSASGSYTKLIQRIPVVISLNDSYSSKSIVPGMNATATIHIN
jgi:multidrug resistance efflux pump